MSRPPLTLPAGAKRAAAREMEAPPRTHFPHRAPMAPTPWQGLATRTQAFKFGLWL